MADLTLNVTIPPAWESKIARMLARVNLSRDEIGKEPYKDESEWFVAVLTKAVKSYKVQADEVEDAELITAFRAAPAATQADVLTMLNIS